MALNSSEVICLSRLPHPAAVSTYNTDFRKPNAIHDVANRHHNDTDYNLKHAVVFVDPDNVESVLDSPAVRGLIDTVSPDFLFVDDHGKKRLRADPLSIPVAEDVHSVPGIDDSYVAAPRKPNALRVVHLTTGGTLKGGPEDLNNFKVPEAWSNVGARLAPLMEQARLDDSELGLIFDAGVDSHDKNIGTAVSSMARAMGNVSRTHDHHKSHPSEVRMGGVDADPNSDEVLHAKTINEMRITTRHDINIVYIASSKDAGDSSPPFDAMHQDGDMVSRLQVASAVLAECPPNLMTAERFVSMVEYVTAGARRLFSVGVTMPQDVSDRGGTQESSHPLEVLRAVHQGSPEAGPYMITVDYRGGKKSDPVDLIIAKTLTMDSGGVSLKPPASQVGMQADMTGGATMLSMLQKIAEEHPKRNMRIVFGVASNRIDGTSYSPNDTYTLSSGRTVHILNTDAEGRLVLADVGGAALQDLKKEGREIGRIVTIATLTGHAILAWGPTTAILGQNIATLRKIQDLGYSLGERFDYSPLLPLDKAAITGNNLGDLTNISDGMSFGASSARGAQSGAAFLAQAMGLSDEQAMRHVHFDIASTLDPFRADAKHNPAVRDWGIPVGSDYMATLSHFLCNDDI